MIYINIPVKAKFRFHCYFGDASRDWRFIVDRLDAESFISFFQVKYETQDAVKYRTITMFSTDTSVDEFGDIDPPQVKTLEISIVHPYNQETYIPSNRFITKTVDISSIGIPTSMNPDLYADVEFEYYIDSDYFNNINVVKNNVPSLMKHWYVRNNGSIDFLVYTYKHPTYSVSLSYAVFYSIDILYGTDIWYNILPHITINTGTNPVDVMLGWNFYFEEKQQFSRRIYEQQFYGIKTKSKTTHNWSSCTQNGVGDTTDCLHINSGLRKDGDYSYKTFAFYDGSGVNDFTTNDVYGCDFNDNLARILGKKGSLMYATDVDSPPYGYYVAEHFKEWSTLWNVTQKLKEVKLQLYEIDLESARSEKKPETLIKRILKTFNFSDLNFPSDTQYRQTKTLTYTYGE